MAGDFNKPALTDNYTAFASAVRDLCADIAKGLDPALSLGTSNTPTNTIRWNSANGYWEKYNGTSWLALASTYNIRSATSDKWHTARSASWSGDLTGTASASIDGSANITLAATLATVNSNTGAFGSATAVPVITVNGKGLITAVTTAALGTIASQNSSAISISGGSIATTAITLPAGTVPTTEGIIQWDTTNDALKIGTGAATATFTHNTGTATLQNKTMSTGCIWNGTAVPVLYGGTGATDAATARTNLGITSIATQAASAVALTGGTIGGVTLTLKQSTSAAPTAEGVIEWDTDDDVIVVGTGAATKIFASITPNTQLTQTNLTLGTNCVWNGGSIGVTYGGTGATTLTSGGILVGNGTGAIGIATAAQIVTAISTNAVNTATNISGGSLGTLVYQSGVGATTTLATGTSGYILKSNGAAAPSWVDASTTHTHTASVITSTAAGNITATNVQAALQELDTEKAQISSSTGAVYVPSGTTAQQPGTPVVGMLRFNSQINSFEGYNNGLAWGSIGGGAKGGGTDDVFYENGQTVNTSYTLTTNKNAMSAGPITIANGVTVTVPNNSVWTIV